jgi:exopolyphosphatase/guanosine-5'-triphosphate,3'-diphosphate pyrophosphatase
MGDLNALNVDNSIVTLQHFKALCDDSGVRRIIAVGTSALREAGNSGDFIDRVLRETGITITVISGDEEAYLTSAGIMAGGVTGDGHAVVVLDIGGGSTEWIVCSDPHHRGSLPVGCVRFTERHIHHDPPLREEIVSLRNDIEQVIRNSPLNILLKLPGGFGDERRACVITGGTATTLASVDLELDHYDSEKIHGHRLPFRKIALLSSRLSSLPAQQRSMVRGLEPDRADVIIAGLLIVEMIMTLGGIGEAAVSDYGLLEGLVVDKKYWTDTGEDN